MTNKKNIRTEDFKLENVRASYPYVFAPRKRVNKDGSVTLKYEVTLLYPKSAGTLMGLTVAGAPLDIAAECARIATEHWGEKAIEMIKSEIIANPFKDGDGKDGLNKKTGERNPGYAGNRFIRCSSGSERPPALFGANLGADGKLVKITDKDVIYPGCIVHAVLNAFTWDDDLGGRGISFGLNMLQFAKDGERMGGTGGPNPDAFLKGAPATVAAGNTGGAMAGNLFA